MTAVRGLVAASAVVVALALAAGLEPGRHWLLELLVVAAMGQGVLAGAAWPRFWRGRPREEIFGAGGRYAGFLAAVAFSAVEAHAVGTSLGPEGAPGPAVAVLLVPPLLLAAVALRSAVKHRAERDGPPEEGGGAPPSPERRAGDPGSGSRVSGKGASRTPGGRRQRRESEGTEEGEER